MGRKKEKEEEERRKREGGKIYVLKRTREGKKRKNLWEGKEGEILIWRGKRGRQQWAKY